MVNGKVRVMVASLAVALAVSAGACSTGAAEDAADRPLSSTTAPSTSSPAPSAPPSTAPPTTADPTAADTITIRNWYGDVNAAYKMSAADGIGMEMAAAWPPGAWVPSAVYCDRDGLSYDAWLARVSRTTPAKQTFVDSVIPSPAWTIPAAGQPGGGQTPPGRTYLVSLTLTVGSHSERTDGHVAVDDGRVWFFPTGCPEQNSPA